jgi:hypothetical protein
VKSRRGEDWKLDIGNRKPETGNSILDTAFSLDTQRVFSYAVFIWLYWRDAMNIHEILLDIHALEEDL